MTGGGGAGSSGLAEEARRARHAHPAGLPGGWVDIPGWVALGAAALAVERGRTRAAASGPKGDCAH